MYLMHRCFRRDLNLFAAAAEAFPASDRARWGRIAARFQVRPGTVGAHRGPLPAFRHRPAQAPPRRGRRTVAAARRARRRGGPQPPRPHERRAARRPAGPPGPRGEQRDDARAAAPDARGLGAAGRGGLQEGLLAPRGGRGGGLGGVGMPDGGSAPHAGGEPVHAPARPPHGATLRPPRGAHLRRCPVTTTKDRLLTVISKYAAKTHVTMARRSGGRLVRPFRGGDVLLLTHTGRTSGRTYTTPALYVRDGDDYVVAASNGGIDREPQWWLNLQADPRGTVEIGGRRTDVVASTVGDRDRQGLWDALMAKCPTY